MKVDESNSGDEPRKILSVHGTWHTGITVKLSGLILVVAMLWGGYTILYGRNDASIRDCRSRSGKAYELCNLSEEAEHGKPDALASLKYQGEHGNADAQVELGAIYSEGLGVRQDIMEGRKWLQLAVIQGDACAPSWLGSNYTLENRNDPKLRAESAKMYAMAIERKCPAGVLLGLDADMVAAVKARLKEKNVLPDTITSSRQRNDH